MGPFQGLHFKTAKQAFLSFSHSRRSGQRRLKGWEDFSVSSMYVSCPNPRTCWLTYSGTRGGYTWQVPDSWGQGCMLCITHLLMARLLCTTHHVMVIH